MQRAWFATALGGALAVMSAVLGQADVRATAALDPAIKAAAELPRLHSLLVSHRGVIILERYFNGRRETTPANVKSVSKSVIAALVGIAVDRKLLSLNDPIAKYFPDSAGARSARITIEDLLTMRSGLESTSNRNYGAWVQSSNWVRHALAKPLAGGAGHADDLQHRQLASPVGDPHEGDGKEHAGSSRRRRSRSRLAFRCRHGCAIRRASTSAATRC